MFKAKRIFILFFVSTFLRLASQSVGGITTGAAAYCDSVNSGFISLISYNGSILFWETSTNGVTWIKIGNNNATQSYTNLKSNQSYRAIIQDGTFPNDTSSVTTISVHVAKSIGAIKGGSIFCANSGAGKLQLISDCEGILYWQTSEDGLNWNNINNTSNVLNYNNIIHTSHYRVIAQPLFICPMDTSEIVSIQVNPSTVAGSILGADSVCYGIKGNTLALNNFTGSVVDWIQSTNEGYTWQKMTISSTQITYTTVTKSVWYKSILKSGVCRSETTAVAIIAPYKINPVEAGDDKTINQFETVILQASGNGFPSWNNANTLSNASVFDPIASPLNTTTYVITLNDSHHCITQDSVQVNVIVPIPTAITPNGDDVNDFFIVDKIVNYPSSTLNIYNRWGKLVYSASPYLNEWNGKSSNGNILPDEIYYYVLDLGNGEKPSTNYILIQR